MRHKGSNDRGGVGRGGGPGARGESAGPPPAVLSFVIGSDFVQGREVQARILGALSSRQFNEQDTFAVKLALEEALINAIKHGNKFDLTKKVRVDARVEDDTVEIEVEDEGAGFERTEVPDPTADENLLKSSGRGILLIESYMNSVQWTKGGRRLRMVKQRQADLLPRR